MIEEKINEFFGDPESTGFGTGWWSGILSAFFGFLSFGGVLCLHFPQLLSSPELRPHYPMHTMRVLIQCLIVGAILFGIVSSILRKKKNLGTDWNVAGHRGSSFGRIERTDYYPERWPETYGLDGEEISPKFFTQTIDPFTRRKKTP